jgi:2-desacetyl-2-hydroxyethyl bacteriochlorophyllide A dehydrogenase
VKAAIYEDIEKIVLKDVETSAPQPGYVVVDTKCSGICGSDLHNYFGEWSQSHTHAQGHEVAGVISEIGEGVEGFAVGDKVTMECFTHDGTCDFCSRGQYNHCTGREWFSGDGQGGFAEQTTMHQSSLFKVPDDMSFEEAALVEPLAVSHRAVMQAGATHRDRVLVIGGGTIGLLALAAAVAAGVRETAITAKYPQQIDVAKALGADHVIDVSDTSVVDYVKDWPDGGVDCVIETVGGGQNFDDSLSCVRKRGSVVLVAGYFEKLEVDLRKIVWSEATVTGSNCYAYSGREKDFDAAIQLISSGAVDPTKIVSHRMPLDEIVEAFRIAADKQSGSVKVHVVQE